MIKPELWIVRTADLNLEQRGAFMTLLAHAWLSDPPCTLPVGDEDLARLSGLGTRWRRLGGAIRAKFDVIEGRLANRDQLGEYAAVVRRAVAGRKGAEARWRHEAN